MQHQRLSLIKTLLLSCTIPWVSLAQVRYSVTEIPTLGGSESVASGINSSTQIVGNATITGDTARHAILWDNGTLTDLGTLGGNFSTANGINSIAQVVGFSRYSTGSDNGHAFLWQNGHMTDLGTLGGPYSAAADINNSGKMVGYSSTPGDSFRHAFLWQGVDGTDLGVLGTGTNAIAYAINNIDQIVGGSQTDGNLSTHVFLWQNGNMTDLNVPGSAYDINNSTQIVGQSLNHAFLWQNGVLTDLLTLGGSTSQAFDINNSGTVVGRAQTSGNVDHAFIWENGVMTDLNTLIDSSSGWILTVANCINDKGEIAGSGKHNGKSRGFLLRPAPRRPVLIIPGVGATYSADVSSDLTWLIHRGVPPSQLQIDPMTKVYHDLIQTLKNVGYVEGKDLFRVNYDWRLPPGPDDGSIDGRVGGFTASSISDSSYLYAVDYLGEILKQASVQWQTDHPGDTLDAVDVITHSTGGLVARVYIQSQAYGGAYTTGKKLPRINNLIMIGVPNRGASKAWNPMHDNWVVDPAFQIVLSKIINRAYQKVLNNGLVIAGPDYNISLASISSPQCLDLPEVCCINQYVPTVRALLATYDFIDFGSGVTNVNNIPGVRNSLLLDLNAGDANAFADSVMVKPTIIYGTNGAPTPTTVVEMTGPTHAVPGSYPIAEFANFVGRNAGQGETYYVDNKVANGGDGTVPLISSRGQFVGDSRVTLMPFTKGGNTTEPVDHTALTYNTDVQKSILGILGISCPAPCSMISTNLHSGGLNAATACAAGCSNFGLDPVDGFLVDAQGRRLGYSESTGPVTEIPGSVWFGDVDGMGWIFGPVEEPLSMELSGRGEAYYASASVLTQTGRGELIDTGVLASGAPRVLPVPITPDQVTEIVLHSSWNMLSIPRTLSDYRKNTLFPSALSSAFAYTSTGYAAKDTLQNGAGYWLKFPSSETISIVGNERINDTISIGPGWNMIGSITSPVAVTGIASIPGGIVTSNFFGYNVSYQAADTIEPGRGYWVKASQAGELILSASSQMPVSSRIRIVSTSELPPPPPDVTTEDRTPNLPSEFSLEQNYPNPFNPSTAIRYSLPVGQDNIPSYHVTLRVYDMLGQVVATLVDGIRQPGTYSVQWDASGLSGGVYFYRIHTGGHVETRKAILLK